MSSYFKNRNFPPLVIENAVNRNSSISHTSALKIPPPNKNKVRILLVLTQDIILRHFRQLQSDLTTKEVVPSTTLSAFHRDCSLRNSLVCSTLPTNPSTFPYNRRKCHTCPYTSLLMSIQ
eukprot:g19711.t1